MKITNDTEGAREYPTLGVILQSGESFDDTKKATPLTQSTPSASSDSTVEEVK